MEKLQLRPAFTIIEILISVFILSTSIIGVLQLYTSKHERIVYVSERNNRTLSDSLYLTEEVLRQHKKTKTAYDLIAQDIKLKTLESRTLLKENERTITIPEAISILPPTELGGPSSLIHEVNLKGKHPSTYWHFEINL